MNPTVETKFITLDNVETSYVKVDMPNTFVFYPYFHFRGNKNSQTADAAPLGHNAYHLSVNVGDCLLAKMDSLEKALFPGRYDEYGFWTGTNQDGTCIGMGVSGIRKFLESSTFAEVHYTIVQRDDLLFAFSISKESADSLNSVLDVYFSDANVEYGKKMEELKELLKKTGMACTDDITAGSSSFTFKRTSYCGKGMKLKKVCETHAIFPEHNSLPFKDNVHSCAWHTAVFEDNIVTEGPRFVLVKNPGVTVTSSLDGISCWLVHRRGGFVMGEEFASNDFHQETTFTVREVDEFVFGGLTVLNVECDTFTKNRDHHFENFLKGLAPERFGR